MKHPASIILTDSRRPDVARARHELIHRLRIAGFQPHEVARMARVSPSTVQYGFKQHERRLLARRFPPA